jgi:hypothetical protein
MPEKKRMKNTMNNPIFITEKIIRAVIIKFFRDSCFRVKRIIESAIPNVNIFEIVVVIDRIVERTPNSANSKTLLNNLF